MVQRGDCMIAVITAVVATGAVVELWIVALGMIGTVVSTLVGVTVLFNWFEHKKKAREDKIQQELELEQEREITRIEELVGPYCQERVDEILQIYADEKDSGLFGKKYDTRLVDLENTLERLNKLVVESEKMRLKAELMNFGEDLKNGLEKSSLAYKHIFNVAERYKELGGNSYAVDLFEYIKEHRKTHERD